MSEALKRALKRSKKSSLSFRKPFQFTLKSSRLEPKLRMGHFRPLTHQQCYTFIAACLNDRSWGSGLSGANRFVGGTGLERGPKILKCWVQGFELKHLTQHEV